MSGAKVAVLILGCLLVFQFCSLSVRPVGASAKKRQLTSDLSSQDRPSLIVADTGWEELGDYFLAYQSWETGQANKGDIFIEKYDRNWNRVKRVQVTSLPSYQDSPSLALVLPYLKLAYVSNETGNWDIFVQVLDLDLNFISKKQVTDSPYTQDLPSIIYDGDQSIYIAYQSWETGESYEGDIFLEKRDLGLGLIGKVRVTTEMSYQDSPSLCYEYLRDDLYVAYASEETGNYEVFVKVYDSNLNYKSIKKQLTADTWPQDRPSSTIAIGYGLRTYVFAYQSWETGESNQGDIFTNRFLPGEMSLGTPYQVTNDQYYEDSPSIIETHYDTAEPPGFVPVTFIAYVSDEAGNWDIWLWQSQDLTPTDLPPVLSNGYVTPTSGGASTIFSYYVKYYDPEGVAPQNLKQLCVDGDQWHAMSLYSGSASNGVYRCQLTLSTGSHNYYFKFSDAANTVYLPSSGTYVGPTVGDLCSLPAGARHKDPSDPSLDTTKLLKTISLNGGGQSVTVNPGQSVSVSLTYQLWAPSNPSEIDQLFFIYSWTPSWPAPSGYYHAVYNGQPGLYPGKSGSDSFTLTAPSNYGTYYLYWCTEAQYNMQNAINQYSQPLNPPAHAIITVVGNPPPVLSNGYVTPSSGYTSTVFSYYVNYYDSGGEVPTNLKQLCIDGSDWHAMSLYSGSASNGVYRCQLTLSGGSHNFCFKFSDAANTVYLPSSGSYPGPTVFPSTSQQGVQVGRYSSGVGGTFTARISVFNWSAPPVYSYEVRLYYDKTVLEAVSAGIPSGHWLTPTLSPSNIFIIDAGTINNTGGYVGFAGTLLGAEPGKTGNGDLAMVTFRVLRNQSCDLRLTVLLVDTAATEILPANYAVMNGNFTPGGLPTDLNGDGIVNVLDIAIVAIAYGSRPGDQRWNPQADLNDDGIVNILDVAMVARDYGKTA